MKSLLWFSLIIALHIQQLEGFRKRNDTKSNKWVNNGKGKRHHHKRLTINRNAAKRELVPNYLRGDNNAYMDGSLSNNYPSIPRDIHDTEYYSPAISEDKQALGGLIQLLSGDHIDLSDNDDATKVNGGSTINQAMFYSDVLNKMATDPLAQHSKMESDIGKEYNLNIDDTVAAERQQHGIFNNLPTGKGKRGLEHELSFESISQPQLITNILNKFGFIHAYESKYVNQDHVESRAPHISNTVQMNEVGIGKSINERDLGGAVGFHVDIVGEIRSKVNRNKTKTAANNSNDELWIFMMNPNYKKGVEKTNQTSLSSVLDKHINLKNKSNNSKPFISNKSFMYSNGRHKFVMNIPVIDLTLHLGRSKLNAENIKISRYEDLKKSDGEHGRDQYVNKTNTRGPRLYILNERPALSKLKTGVMNKSSIRFSATKLPVKKKNCMQLNDTDLTNNECTSRFTTTENSEDEKERNDPDIEVTLENNKTVPLRDKDMRQRIRNFLSQLKFSLFNDNDVETEDGTLRQSTEQDSTKTLQDTHNYLNSTDKGNKVLFLVFNVLSPGKVLSNNTVMERKAINDTDTDINSRMTESHKNNNINATTIVDSNPDQNIDISVQENDVELSSSIPDGELKRKVHYISNFLKNRYNTSEWDDAIQGVIIGNLSHLNTHKSGMESIQSKAEPTQGNTIANYLNHSQSTNGNKENYENMHTVDDGFHTLRNSTGPIIENVINNTFTMDTQKLRNFTEFLELNKAPENNHITYMGHYNGDEGNNVKGNDTFQDELLQDLTSLSTDENENRVCNHDLKNKNVLTTNCELPSTNNTETDDTESFSEMLLDSLDKMKHFLADNEKLLNVSEGERDWNDAIDTATNLRDYKTSDDGYEEIANIETDKINENTETRSIKKNMRVDTTNGSVLESVNNLVDALNNTLVEFKNNLNKIRDKQQPSVKDYDENNASKLIDSKNRRITKYSYSKTNTKMPYKIGMSSKEIMSNTSESLGRFLKFLKLINKAHVKELNLQSKNMNVTKSILKLMNKFYANIYGNDVDKTKNISRAGQSANHSKINSGTKEGMPSKVDANNGTDKPNISQMNSKSAKESVDLTSMDVHTVQHNSDINGQEYENIASNDYTTSNNESVVFTNADKTKNHTEMSSKEKQEVIKGLKNNFEGKRREQMDNVTLPKADDVLNHSERNNERNEDKVHNQTSLNEDNSSSHSGDKVNSNDYEADSIALPHVSHVTIYCKANSDTSNTNCNNLASTTANHLDTNNTGKQASVYNHTVPEEESLSNHSIADNEKKSEKYLKLGNNTIVSSSQKNATKAEVLRKFFAAAKPWISSQHASNNQTNTGDPEKALDISMNQLYSEMKQLVDEEEEEGNYKISEKTVPEQEPLTVNGSDNSDASVRQSNASSSERNPLTLLSNSGEGRIANNNTKTKGLDKDTIASILSNPDKIILIVNDNDKAIEVIKHIKDKDER